MKNNVKKSRPVMMIKNKIGNKKDSKYKIIYTQEISKPSECDYNEFREY